MNFREQLSEAYKAGFNQGLQELQEKQSPQGGGKVPTSTKPEKRPQRGGDPLGGRKPISAGYHEGMKRGLMAGYHEAMKEMDEGMHEMDEKALAELGRMMIRAGMHEMDHEMEEENAPDVPAGGFYDPSAPSDYPPLLPSAVRDSPIGFDLQKFIELRKPILGRLHRRKITKGYRDYDPEYRFSDEYKAIERDMRDNPDDYQFPGGTGSG